VFTGRPKSVYYIGKGKESLAILTYA